MTDSKLKPAYYTVEREFLEKISAAELIRCLVKSHILQDTNEEADES